MKRILVFSDLHANRQALLDIEQIIKAFDLSIFCGDILGYGTDIDYCIDFILNNVDLVVLGNHDRLVVTDDNLEYQHPVVKESILSTRSKLSTKQIEAISSLPSEIWYKDIYVTHSINDSYLRKEDDFKLLYKKSMSHEGIRYIFFGHTHEQVLYKYNERTVINPGSITKGRKGSSRGYLIFDKDDKNDKDDKEEIKFIDLRKIL